MNWFYLGLTLLLLVFAVRYRRRLPQRSAKPPVHVTDDIVAQIEQRGIVYGEEDDRLDMEHIRKEEREFWKEAEWDEPESW